MAGVAIEAEAEALIAPEVTEAGKRPRLII